MLTRQNLKQETEYNTVWLSICTVLHKVTIWNRDKNTSDVHADMDPDLTKNAFRDPDLAQDHWI